MADSGLDLTQGVRTEELYATPPSCALVIGFGGAAKDVVIKLDKQLGASDHCNIVYANYPQREIVQTRPAKYGDVRMHAIRRCSTAIERHVIVVAGLGGTCGGEFGYQFSALRARSDGCVLHGVFTMPFQFESEQKHARATEQLCWYSDIMSTVAVISNEDLLDRLDRNTMFKNCLDRVRDLMVEEIVSLLEDAALGGADGT